MQVLGVNIMNKLFNEAVTFAVNKHKNQTRKQTSWPYAVHLYDVSQILLENGADINTVIAGVLHDTVEDTDTTLNEIQQKFGTEIAYLVDLVTEIKGLPYTERKKRQAIRIASASRNVKMVKCADCLSNLKSIEHELIYYPEVWSKFHSTKDNIGQHYLDIITAVNELEGLEMYEQLKSSYSKVFECKLSLIQKDIVQHSSNFTPSSKYERANTVIQNQFNPIKL